MAGQAKTDHAAPVHGPLAIISDHGISGAKTRTPSGKSRAASPIIWRWPHEPVLKKFICFECLAAALVVEIW